MVVSVDNYSVAGIIGGMKKITYIRRALRDLRCFPAKAQLNALRELDRVVRGKEPTDWKPMKTIGKGVREIRLRDETGIYRVVYVATFKDAVYVLHAFQKKTQATSKRDIDIAKRNYRELAR